MSDAASRNACGIFSLQIHFFAAQPLTKSKSINFSFTFAVVFNKTFFQNKNHWVFSPRLHSTIPSWNQLNWRRKKPFCIHSLRLHSWKCSWNANEPSVLHLNNARGFQVADMKQNEIISRNYCRFQRHQFNKEKKWNEKVFHSIKSLLNQSIIILQFTCDVCTALMAEIIAFFIWWGLLQFLPLLLDYLSHLFWLLDELRWSSSSSSLSLSAHALHALRVFSCSSSSPSFVVMKSSIRVLSLNLSSLWGF